MELSDAEKRGGDDMPHDQSECCKRGYGQRRVGLALLEQG